VFVCRLLSVDVVVEADLYVSYTFKLSSSCDVLLGVGLTCDGPVSQLWLVGDDKGYHDYSVLTQSDVNCLRFAEQKSVGSWTTRCELSLTKVSQLCLSFSPIVVT